MGTSVIRFHFTKIELPFSAISICAFALLVASCGTTATPTPLVLPDAKTDNGQADLAQDDGTDAATADTVGKDSATDVEQDSGPDSAAEDTVDIGQEDVEDILVPDLGAPDAGDVPDVPPPCGGKAFALVQKTSTV